MIGFWQKGPTQNMSNELHEHSLSRELLTKLASENRVFLCFLRKELYKSFPWKTKKNEGDYDADRLIISVTKSESDEYDWALKQPRNPKIGRKKGQEKLVEEHRPTKLTVIEEHIRVDLHEDIFAQKIPSLGKATLSRGKYDMILIIIEGVKYLGIIQDGSFVGKPLSTWQLYLQRDKGEPKVSIEDFESLESLSTT